MNWRDDPYIRALVRGAILLNSAIFLGAGATLLCMYFMGFQKETLWVSIALLALGIAALLWRLAEVNGPRGKKKKGG